MTLVYLHHLLWLVLRGGLFKSRLVTKQSKLKLYGTVIRPIVTYASETWVLKETVFQKLLVFERKILRRIFGPTKQGRPKYRWEDNIKQDIWQMKIEN